MRSIIALSLFVLLGVTAHSQKKTFVRIYDQHGKKTHAGFLSQLSDSFFIVEEHKNYVHVFIPEVSKIKLRRSIGHTILITSLITGGAAAILGAATAEPDAAFFGYTAGEGFLAGLFGGAATGALIGSIIGGTRSKPEFLVKNNQENWTKIKPVLQKYLPKETD